jgi:hypothetical protein
MTPHEGQFFRQRHKLDPKRTDIQLLNHDPSARLEDTQEFPSGCPLVSHMVHCVHHHDPVEAVRLKRQLLGV